MTKDLSFSDEEIELLRSVLDKAIKSERGSANYHKSAPGQAHDSANVDHSAALSRKEALQKLLARLPPRRP